MVGKTEQVLASQGQWTAVRSGDAIVEFVGSFARDDAHAALGTMRFLNRSSITHGYRALEEYNDGFVIRLKASAGDRLDKFSAWAYRHDLVPGLKRSIDRREAEALLREIEESRFTERRFTPWAAAKAKEAVGSLSWEMADGCTAPGKGSLVTDVTDPELAFQAAYYLHKKHFITADEFERHNAAVNMALDEGGAARFRMAVPAEKIADFEKSFPDAGTQKPDGWTAQAQNRTPRVPGK